MKYSVIKNILHLSLGLILLCSSCKKLIEVDSPKNQLSTDKAFIDSTTANAVMVNVYAKLEKSFQPLLSKYLGLYTDEFNNSNNPEYLQSLLAPANGINQNCWAYLYETIYQCNDILEQLPLANNLSPAFKNQLEGESKFLRAWAYCYLVNLYAEVPLILQTDVNINKSAGRNSNTLAYDAILSDLLSAKTKLNNIPATTKERANAYTCSALLARVYLYLEKWQLAENEANIVISNSFYNLTDPIVNSFRANSRESILQLWTQNGFITDAVNYMPGSATTAPSYAITPNLYQAFEATDLRKTNWIGSTTVSTGQTNNVYYYANKYKNKVVNTANPEYLVVLRLAEQYLIRAEARTMQNKLTGTGSATEDLNKIRKRAGLNDTPAQTADELLTAISNERRLELFSEWADRFIDLKRNHRLNTVMNTYKSTWKASSALLPIPQLEITYNKNLTQNEGY